MFEIKKVAKKYHDDYVLQDVSFHINKGLNFIVGASGSGKTTLLKIISGMDRDFEGEVIYCNHKMKELTADEKSYFYNNIFGFVFQDFNLLEELTVLDNVLLPVYIKEKKGNVNQILKELQIFDFKNKKVKYLSGGQKQRVAIARELMKNPNVLIADEPTSALDGESTKVTMDILRSISKTRTVIIVTHDTSLIEKNDTVFELDKGELVSKPLTKLNTAPNIKVKENQALLFNQSSQMVKATMRGRIGHFVTATLAIMMAGVLFLTTMSGAIHQSSQREFDQLLATYGESLFDIGIHSSFINASGTSGGEDGKPNGDVNQDISGLYDRYVNDERLSFAVYLQAFDHIQIKLDGSTYKIDSSGNSALINKLVFGRIPSNTSFEVVVPESFVKTLGMTSEEVIGKELSFEGEIADWSSGEPVFKNTGAKVKIVGVMDTTVTYESSGKMMEYTVDDSFIFSKNALAEMRNKVGLDLSNSGFSLRAKTAADMISLKDELNEQGVVPLGRFELVEDMVRLNQQSTEQSSSASAIVGVLAIVMVIIIFMITGVMRKREYAIYQVSGFTRSNLNRFLFTETLFQTLTSIILFVVASPLLNLATQALFQVSINNFDMILMGIVFIGFMGVLSYAATVLTSLKINIGDALKTGDK